MPSKVKLIVTADDYGIIREIDDAIISGVKAGIINTISVVVNFKRCKKALKKLIGVLVENKLLSKVGIGLHLNITMGPPVSDKRKIKSLLSSKKNFYTHRTYQGNPDLKRFELNEIREEAIGQMQVFIKYLTDIAKDEGIQNIPIDHISSHFNLFNSIPILADILIDLSNNFKKFGSKKTLPIPVRRPIPIIVEYKDSEFGLKPKLKEISKETKGYIFAKNLSLGALFYKSKWLKKDKLRNLIDTKFKANKIRCPHAMFICFYATQNDFQKKIDQLIRILKDVRKAAVNDGIISTNQPLFIEVIHHLGNNISDNRKDQIKISGFDKRYMKKYRPNEVSIIKEDRYKELFNIGGISRGQFSEIPKIS